MEEKFDVIHRYTMLIFFSGEHAFEIQVIPSSSSKDTPCKIVVLGVKSIFVLHHSGVLAYSKKLDFNPVTMLTYTSRKLEFDKKKLQVYSNCLILRNITTRSL